MFCTKCGGQLESRDRFCSQCGAVTGPGGSQQSPGTANNRLSRSREDRKLAGVCAGVARYFGVDVTLVRILTVALTIWPIGVGAIVYIVCWIAMPDEPLMLPAATAPVVNT